MAVSFGSATALRGDASPNPVSGNLFHADFAAGEYFLGRRRAAFDELVNFERAQVNRYVDPLTREWVVCGGGVPVMYAPDGRRGLNLANVQGALYSGTPTAAGSSAQVYTSARDNVACTLICYGRDGAEVALAGDYAPAVPGQAVARPYEPLHLTLTGGARALSFSFNDQVIGYKLTIIPWDEWTGSVITGGATGPNAKLQPAAVAALNAAAVLDIRGKYLAHSHRTLLAQTNELLTLLDGDGNLIRLDNASGSWRLTATQTVATGAQPDFTRSNIVCRPRPPVRAARDLEFRLVWDKVARRAALWVDGVQIVTGMTMPDMGALVDILLARAGSTPRYTVARLAAYAA